jgi:hypothetical protein
MTPPSGAVQATFESSGDPVWARAAPPFPVPKRVVSNHLLVLVSGFGVGFSLVHATLVVASGRFMIFQDVSGSAVNGYDIYADMVSVSQAYFWTETCTPAGLQQHQVRKAPSKLAQKLGQPQPFVTVLPQECMGQRRCVFWANLTVT